MSFLKYHFLICWKLILFSPLFHISTGGTKEKEDLSAKQAAAMRAVEAASAAKTSKSDSASAVSNVDLGNYARKVVSFLARNFFTMKFIALAIAFIINFMLLFYKVSQVRKGIKTVSRIFFKNILRTFYGGCGGFFTFPRK